MQEKKPMSRDKMKKERKSLGQVIKLALQLLFLLFLIIIAGGIFYFYHAYGKTIIELQAEAKQKVATSTLNTFKASQTSLVYDTRGNLISTLKAEKDVYYIEFNSIPSVAIDAMVVSEDRKFLEHDGVDYWANIRAAIALIKHKGEITQGASTITQQLARNIFLTQEVTYVRKIEEIFVAQELEKIYSKAEIMEFYLNGIYFANGHYGLQAAAQGYFGEGVTGLSLSQIVFLCAIPNSPNTYNPLTKLENTLARRDRILLQLYDEGRITGTQYKDAVNEKMKLSKQKSNKKDYVETYTYYSAIRALMKEQGFAFRNQFDSEEEQEAYEEEYYDLYYRYQKDLYVRGYRIYTSIDLEKQKLLQKSVDKALKGFTDVNDEGIFQMQGAAVCIDNDSGRVVAIVGGRGQKLRGYTLNRGYQSFRQPGSAIKPLIVYTPSFERNYTPDSIVVDEKIEDGPRNSGGSYLGKIKLQRAIELSKNTIAWKLFEELTPTVGLSYLLNMNFAKISATDYVPAASLGGFTIGVSPVEMAAAYATLENDGYYRVPTCIVKIMDSEGNEIVGDAMETKQIYQTNAARIMTETLTGAIKRGTAKGLGLTNTISAGKTGTTNDKKDGWFVGYTPYYTTSVWVGYDMPKAVDDLKGASYPGTIWHSFMEQLHNASRTKKFELYDWRAPIRLAREAEEMKKALEDAEAKALEAEAETEETEVEEDGNDEFVAENTDLEADSTGDNLEDGDDLEDNPIDETGGDNPEDIGTENNTEDTSTEDISEEENAEEDNTEEENTEEENAVEEDTEEENVVEENTSRGDAVSEEEVDN